MCAAPLVVLGAQGSIIGVAACWMAAQAAQNAMFAGLTATIPDQVPVRRRGVVSGWVGPAGPLGLVLGALLVTRAGAGYVALAVLLVALTTPLVLTTKDARTDRAPRSLRLLDQPAQVSRFRVAAVSRLANAMATLYLLYFLRDSVRIADPVGGVLDVPVPVVVRRVLSGTCPHAPAWSKHPRPAR